MTESTFGSLEPLFRKTTNELMKKPWFTCHPNNKSKETKQYCTYLNKVMNTPEFKQKMLDYATHMAIYGNDMEFDLKIKGKK